MATKTAPVEKASSTVTGSAGAALLASGIGCFAIGLMTTLAAASTGLSNALKFVGPVGPLSGKTTVAVVVWLVAWAILHFAWRGKDRGLRGVYSLTLILIALGFLGTFPIFFDLFAGG